MAGKIDPQRLKPQSFSAVLRRGLKPRPFKTLPTLDAALKRRSSTVARGRFSRRSSAVRENFG